MAVSRETLRLARELRRAVGEEADDAVRALTHAWVKAWNGLTATIRRAVADIVDLAIRLARWPLAWELNRLPAVTTAIRAAEAALLKLAQATGTTASTAAAAAIAATVAAEPAILASQLPSGERVAAAISFDRVPTAAIDAIVRRTGEHITARSWPLADAAVDVMRRELIRGVTIGANPRETARRMVAQVEGAFNGGLTRALNIARTETLDAYREASRISYLANDDVVAGWRWQCALTARSCVACWSKHGTVYEVDVPGPWDHQSGRCARVPVLRPWSDLGISAKEPDDLFPDARTRFNALSKADQLAIMGPTRLDLLQSGRIDWDDLAVRRTTPGWRDSYTPRPVADLQRTAARQAA